MHFLDCVVGELSKEGKDQLSLLALTPHSVTSIWGGCSPLHKNTAETQYGEI